MQPTTKWLIIKDKHGIIRIEYKALIGKRRLKRLIATREAQGILCDEHTLNRTYEFLLEKIVSWNIISDGALVPLTVEAMEKLPIALIDMILIELDAAQ